MLQAARASAATGLVAELKAGQATDDDSELTLKTLSPTLVKMLCSSFLL